MAKKQLIKDSEARILIYLEVVNPQLRNVKNIGFKLNLGRNYLYDIIAGMEFKGWVRRVKSVSCNYIELTKQGTVMLQAAKEMLASR